MVTPTNHFTAWAGFILRELFHFGDFCDIFLTNIGKGQKNVLPSERGPLTLCHMVNPALDIALRSQKGWMRACGSNF